ncbi:TonB-dependent Receptor Plug Domain protein [compost metagenome]
MNGKNHSKEISGGPPPISSKTYFRRLVRLKALLFTCIFLVLGIKACFAQSISLQAKNMPLEQVIKQLRSQTDYSIMLSSNVLEKAKPVTINLKDISIEQALKEIFKNQPITYEIKGRNIIVREISEQKSINKPPQESRGTKSGRVLDQAGNPIAGATVNSSYSGIATSTTNSGAFEISVQNGDLLTIRMLGYEPREIEVNGLIGEIRLNATNVVMETAEVINTGYQSIPKERATGSFSTVNNELLNQQVSTDIISRLPNIANSVMMDQSGYDGQIMVRGLSTISGPKDPLIVIDNFPYEGSLNNINPNIIENVTILKDASAASIWGAKAANGVIVITTKKGAFQTPINVKANASLTIGNKPDLDYIRQMSSSDFIDVEQELFKRGFYDSKLSSSNKPAVSPVVDLLEKASKGLITPEEANTALNELRTVDVRKQFNKHMYKPSFKQQYFLNAQGGTDKFSWLSSVGYDQNKETLGEKYNRVNIRFQNTYRPLQNISISTNLYYTQTVTGSGRYGYSDIENLFPYTKMVGEDGSALAVPKNWNMSYLKEFGDGKLLDWLYYPITDWQHNTSKSTTSSLLASLGAKYQLIDGLSATIDYQYQRESANSTRRADIMSYTARDYINSFTQIINNAAVYIVPKGDILDKASNSMNVHNLRGQLAFDRTYGRHNVNAIAGAEIRSIDNNGNQARYYGYNPNNLTTGNVDYILSYPNIITGGSSTVFNGNQLTETDKRFVSQFANAAYTFDGKYILSGSIRRDASNLFGLKTNDQWNPFWSTGLAWNVSKEQFYNVEFLPYLNLRATYGFSGNIDPAMVAVNTIRFLPRPSNYTNSPVALFENYYNPELRWETSKMFNAAIDFRAKENRISGSLEYYHKKGINLFGTSQIDITTGVSPYMLRNVAGMKGNGLDIELKTINVLASLFKWHTIFNFSLYKDKIAEYNVDRSLAAFYISTNVPPISGVKDHPVYAMYGYKWAGLDPENGAPRGYLNGQISTDYASITGEGTPITDLQYFGSAIPTKFGSMINSFEYKNISLQIGITYKLGYWFRRSSINYSELFNNYRGHSDFAARWQKPGDELHTNIPALDYESNSNRDQFFEGSSLLVEKGDHIRLQYINLSYNLRKLKNFKTTQIFVNASNLGIIWKANKSGIDPDFNINLNRYVTPSNYSIGFRTQF